MTPELMEVKDTYVPLTLEDFRVQIFQNLNFVFLTDLTKIFLVKVYFR
jgi:hypothetical protein